MKIILQSLIFIFITNFVSAQIVKYSAAWFGPNANPVPEFTEARIPEYTTAGITGDYYYGFGDKTKSSYLKIEIPLISERVSIKIWNCYIEHYNVTDAISTKREMANHTTSGNATGDLYVQTRILILKEGLKAPAIIFNSTLKTASGSNFEERRFFDTPGYFFDIEVGKSFPTHKKFISDIRLVTNFGFMCWEAIDYAQFGIQNDAPLMGEKIVLTNHKWKFESTLSGYWGWMYSNHHYGKDYADTPIVFASKFTIPTQKMDYFVQFQKGILDFPYNQIRMGLNIELKRLTPKFR